jgi:hypothetical protein
MAALYPLPNRAETTGNFVSSPIGPHDVWQVTGRSDFHLPKDRTVFVRYSFARDDNDAAFPGPGKNLPRFGTRTVDNTQNLAVGFTRTFGSRTFNDLRLGWNRPAPRRVSRQHGRRRLRAARHDGAGARARRPWLSRDHDDRLRPGRRRRIAAGRAQHGHVAPH